MESAITWRLTKILIFNLQIVNKLILTKLIKFKLLIIFLNNPFYLNKNNSIYFKITLLINKFKDNNYN